MRFAFVLWFLFLFLGFVACSPKSGAVVQSPEDAHARSKPSNSKRRTNSQTVGSTKNRDIWWIYQQLELAVDENRASVSDRRRAVHTVRVLVDDRSAKFAFARAAVVGRYAEVRGLKAINLAREVEKYAKLSNKRDPEFLDGQARRMLGTLYIFAGEYLKGGDSESGLELLEELREKYPNNQGHALRLAQAYIVLNDPEPAIPILCDLRSAPVKRLRPSEQRILESLADDIGGWKVATCRKHSTSE